MVGADLTPPMVPYATDNDTARHPFAGGRASGSVSVAVSGAGASDGAVAAPGQFVGGVVADEGLPRVHTLPVQL